MSKDDAPATDGELLIYPAQDGAGIRVLLAGETVWLTQARIAELYQTTPQNITQHLKAIYAEGELEETATCKDYLQVRQEGERSVSRQAKHYRLEAILAVGYRVRSARGTEFRRWATATLAGYLTKGFVLDDERLKGSRSVADHYDELLARIRDIRASEARVYQRVREIMAMAVDYREGDESTRHFFAGMQNKMHYAATGLTAAEIIRHRADATKPNMGVNAWTRSRVQKKDVGTAKNYLDVQEIDTLNRITVMFLDQSEFRAMRRQDIRLHDWDGFLDKFLRDTELPVLDNPGKVSHADAVDWALREYDAFAERRRLDAERIAGDRYVEDLRRAARMLETATTAVASDGDPAAVDDIEPEQALNATTEPSGTGTSEYSTSAPYGRSDSPATTPGSQARPRTTTGNNSPRLIVMALPPPQWIDRALEKFSELGLTNKLGNRLLRPELWHQSFSDRIDDPTRKQCDDLIAICGGISARAATLQFNRIEGPAVEAGKRYCTLRARGVPKSFAALRQAIRERLDTPAFASIATGVTPHMTLSYSARTSFANIPIDPPLAWTIDELCLVIGGGEPYGYEVIGRWPLLPDLAPVVQTQIF